MDPAELPLRDIHLPGELSWWPPAVGWWLLILLSIVALWLVFSYWKKRNRIQPVRLLHEQLVTIEQAYAENKDGHQLVRGLSRFLRQTALQLAPRGDVASLTGESWLNVLDGLVPSESGVTLQTEAGKSLLTAPYDPKVVNNATEVLNLVKTWFGQLEARL